jgi:hypothetical protein
LSKYCPHSFSASFSDSSDDYIRHPHLEKGTQSSANEHLRVPFCFPITPAYTPIKKFGWVLDHHIPKAARVQIKGEYSEEAFVFHFIFAERV